MRSFALVVIFAIGLGATAQDEEIVWGSKDSLSIIGVGDIMMGTTYPSERYLPPNDGADLFTAVKEILCSADCTFGNLEGAVSDDAKLSKSCNDPSICYAFRQPERYIDYLEDAGFDCVSLANNHSGDFGSSGRNTAMQLLEDHGIAFSGLTTCPTALWESEGITYGLASFAPNSGTVDIRDIDGAVSIVAGLDSVCDIVIVSFHGGAEGSKHRHVPREIETYYGENRGNVYEFAHSVVDAGADIVFGHGPHITRGVELYNDRIISYSLGNFCTYARFNLSGHNGVAPILQVWVTPEGEFLSGQITSIKQEGEGIPFIDPDHTAVKEILELNAEDFPESPLKISNDGALTK